MVENGSNVRLMDLGISRINEGNKFSQYGPIGTPEYSAPEQIKREEGNDTNPINATTDIYELGITFYELLAGNNPMNAGSDAETYAKQLSESLPSDTSIPKKLMNVIWKATEKEQSKRYQTALEFKNAIINALLPEPPLSERVSNWIKSHIIAMAVVIVAIALTIFFIILLLI